ncbi:MAG: HepT-like ribonuclease domain-containing protein [Candidatus Levyibacteriota bacterium]
MSGMRDILIHKYEDIDEDIVWKTITQKFLL